jgi:GTPase
VIGVKVEASEWVMVPQDKAEVAAENYTVYVSNTFIVAGMAVVAAGSVSWPGERAP